MTCHWCEFTQVDVARVDPEKLPHPQVIYGLSAPKLQHDTPWGEGTISVSSGAPASHCQFRRHWSGTTSFSPWSLYASSSTVMRPNFIRWPPRPRRGLRKEGTGQGATGDADVKKAHTFLAHDHHVPCTLTIFGTLRLKLE